MRQRLSLCLNKESLNPLVFIIPVHMKREERNSKAPLLIKHQNFISIYAFEGKTDVSLNVSYYHSRE